MKKSVKKMELKKRSISTLNAKGVTGGLPSTTSVVSVICATKFYYGEDLCFTAAQQ